MKKVSLVVPIRNEEKNIKNCIESIIGQTFPIELMQIIFIDGMSTDRTVDIVKGYSDDFPGVFVLLENPEKITPVAMNIGIEAATGEYIIRLDAHSEYAPDYIEKCVKTLETVEADNVGGLALTKGDGAVGETYAQVLSSKFGVGNSGFRTGAASGYVDTVPFGAFRRETFEKYGLYDERLVRNQDYELNYRIRESGGRIYLNSDIQLFYKCKNTWSGIIKQAFDNGKWNVITMKFCPGSMSKRHFIPLLFVLSLIGMPIACLIFGPFKFLFAAELSLYGLLDVLFAAKNEEPRYKNHFLGKIIMFPVFHISYGIGSLTALLNKI